MDVFTMTNTNTSNIYQNQIERTVLKQFYEAELLSLSQLIATEKAALKAYEIATKKFKNIEATAKAQRRKVSISSINALKKAENSYKTAQKMLCEQYALIETIKQTNTFKQLFACVAITRKSIKFLASAGNSLALAITNQNFNHHMFQECIAHVASEIWQYNGNLIYSPHDIRFTLPQQRIDIEAWQVSFADYTLLPYKRGDKKGQLRLESPTKQKLFSLVRRFLYSEGNSHVALGIETANEVDPNNFVDTSISMLAYAKFVETLTDRQAQVARLTDKGYKIQEIADLLKISPDRVKELKKQVIAKFKKWQESK